jgi:isoleucyl-tRNA synthetase
MYEHGFLYKGFTIQPFSPAAGTGLSSHELNMPGTYKPVKDTTVVAQFKVKNEQNLFILAWTTTPWTLPSNSALAVGKDIEYVKVETHNQYTNQPITVILAKAALSRMFTPDKYVPANEYDETKHTNKIPFKVIENFKGSVLVGTQYEQLFPYKQPLYDAEKAFRVIDGDFVSTEDGTGVVHIAPTFGADDFRVARQHGVPPITVRDEHGKEMPLVNRQGKFVEGMGEFSGMYVKGEYESVEVSSKPDYKPADVLLAIKLKEANRAFKVEKYEHNYPHCWRTDKPILYYPLDSWFIKTTAIKDKLVENNKKINWKPASTGEGRFGNWLENLVDWNLSRSRFWGTPLPIWTNEEGEQICVGSVAEICKNIEFANASGVLTEEEQKLNRDFLAKAAKNDTDLHRPYVDYITFVSETGKKLKREPDLVDVWFDSGAMPYAQWHYPFENEAIFNKSYPADFIAEGVDQTRGWFFTLHAIAGLMQAIFPNDARFQGIAFKNVISNGLLLDKNGNKMSKRLGNLVNPFEMVDSYGSDPVRWYMMENCPPWENLKFDVEGVKETLRKFFGTLQNTYNFFALYANLDNFVFDEKNQVAPEKRTESDRWILSRLHTLIAEVKAAYDDYEPTKAARAIQSFVVDDLSNWYVRLNRKRFWVGAMNEDKKAAYETLYACLYNVSVLMSPIAPFYSDKMYRDLQGEKVTNETSVHLADFPKADSTLINNDLEERMSLAQRICSLVHSLRKKEKIRVRLPLGKLLIPALDAQMKSRIEAVKEVILAEVNVKNLEFIGEDSEILVKKIKPNFKRLGKTLGALMKEFSAAVEKMTQSDIKQLEKAGSMTFVLGGESKTFVTEDFEISSQDIPGWLTAAEGNITVALDITITPELEREGLARDFVNRIQNLRKDKGLDVQDKINIVLHAETPDFVNAVREHKVYICAETQALSLEVVAERPANATEVDMEEFKIAVEI